MDLKQHIRSVPTFPSRHPVLRHSTLLAHPGAWHATVERLAARLRAAPGRPARRIESRGFWSRHPSPTAWAAASSWCAARQAAGEDGSVHLDLELASDTIEIQADAISRGQRRRRARRSAGDRGTMAGGDRAVPQRRGTVAAAAAIIELTFSAAASASTCPSARSSLRVVSAGAAVGDDGR